MKAAKLLLLSTAEKRFTLKSFNFAFLRDESAYSSQSRLSL